KSCSKSKKVDFAATRTTRATEHDGVAVRRKCRIFIAEPLFRWGSQSSLFASFGREKEQASRLIGGDFVAYYQEITAGGPRHLRRQSPEADLGHFPLRPAQSWNQQHGDFRRWQGAQKADRAAMRRPGRAE